MPESTSAATIAMPSGLIRTPPVPTVCAATPASSAAVSADPENAATRMLHGAPTPKDRSMAVSCVDVSFSDMVANAVPHPAAKSEAKVDDDDGPGR